MKRKWVCNEQLDPTLREKGYPHEPSITERGRKIESQSGRIPQFEIGDTVNVHCHILEGDGGKATRSITGVVIARAGGGSRDKFTVRRIVQGEGVERKFPIHSPKIGKIVVQRSGVAHRPKLALSSATASARPCDCGNAARKTKAKE